MRKKWKGWTLGGLCLLVLASAFSSMNEEPISAKAADNGLLTTSNTTVRVALPYSDSDVSFPFYKEYCKAIGEYANWNVEFVVSNWADIFTKLQNNEVDLLVDVTPTAERSQYLSYSSESMGTEMCYLYAKEGSSLHYDDFSAFNGMKVGYLAGSTIIDSFQTYADANSFTFTKTAYATNYDSFVGLDKGEVDAVAQTNFFEVPSGHQIISKCSPAPVYFAARKGDALISQLDKAMATLFSYNPNFNNDLYLYYFSNVLGQPSAYSNEEIAYLEKKPTVYFLYESNWAPFEYDSDGTAEGITPDVVRAIGEDTKINFQFLLSSSTADVYAQIGNNNADAAMAVSYSYLWSDEHDLYTTQSYVEGGVMEVRKSSNVVPSKVATVKNGYLENEISKKFSSLNRVQFSTFNECMAALKAGTVDCVFLNSCQANYYRSMSDFASYFYQPTPLISQPIALGVTKNSNSVLVSILSKAIQKLSMTKLQSIISENSVFVEPFSVTGLIRRYPVPMAFSIAFFALLLALFVFLLIYAHKRQKQNQALSLAKQEAEEANRAKSEFLSRMSHDIRTPLNGIIGMTYLAKEESTSPQVSEYLDKIDTSSKFLLGLVNDILDMSKAESGKIVLHLEPYPIKDCLDYLDAVITPLVHEKNQKFVKTCTAINERIPLLDKLRVNQILFNLLSNAVKFTPNDGTIKATFDDHLEKDNTITLHFAIEDNGIGMSEKFLKVIFEPFTQEDHPNDPSLPRQGTGLGLTITKKLVETMGGTIKVDSHEGKGTRFDVTLHSATISKEEYAARLEAIRTQKNIPLDVLKGKRILLCEDNALNQEIARKLLLDKGMEVVIAGDGEKGLGAFRASEEGHFDVVLMDIRMPVMDGYAATKAIRSLPRNDAKNVPIIAMTADAFADDVQKCLDGGMNAHIAKPINPNLLYQKLAKFMAERYRE